VLGATASGVKCAVATPELLPCPAPARPTLQKPRHHTVSDYERVGELKFGLLVWRANLKRDASLASDGQELEKQLEDAYTDALRWAAWAGPAELLSLSESLFGCHTLPHCTCQPPPVVAPQGAQQPDAAGAPPACLQADQALRHQEPAVLVGAAGGERAQPGVEAAPL
jgi:hypothetical protein